MSTRWRRTVTVIVTVLAMALVVPVSAYAAVVASAKASQQLTVLTWKAVAVSAGGSAASGTYKVTFLKSNQQTQTSRQAVFDIVNTGTSALSAVTLTASSSSGVSSSKNVSYSVCSSAWTASTSNGVTSYSCNNSSGVGNTSNGGNGTVTISRSIAVGARLYVRASTTSSSNNTSVSQTISIKVSRSQAAAKRNR